ncbi:MAG: hypothetical protein Q8P81_04735 [Nanoarchaeota archaeon]|nr:hypothetical protein [Nanoarchaeota archaeon]
MVKLGNPKNVFWEAFLLTVIVFVFGLFIGVLIEGSRVQDINDYYENSEISLIDILALNSVATLEGSSCDDLIDSSLAFADRIYDESKILDNYDEANKISDRIQIVHKKYDLLRTLLWVGSSKTQEQCDNNFSIVVYLYHRDTADINERATQNVWSKILGDLKEKKGSEIVLIPISVDSELSSLKAMTAKYDIDSYPVVIINGKVITKTTSVADLEDYLVRNPEDASTLRLN